MNYENIAQVKLETFIPAQKILQQVQIHQEEIMAQVESGVKKAIDGFSFEAEAEKQTKEIIERSIREAISKGNLKEMIQKKVNEIADKIADNYWNEFLK